MDSIHAYIYPHIKQHTFTIILILICIYVYVCLVCACRPEEGTSSSGPGLMMAVSRHVDAGNRTGLSGRVDNCLFEMFVLFLIMCLCVGMCTCACSCPWSPERAVSFPGAGVTSRLL